MSVLQFFSYNKSDFVVFNLCRNVNPIYFDDNFQFQDPDVKLTGIESYARGVTKIFNQDTSRAQIISTVVNTAIPNTITVTWRLSGGVNIGPGLTIKPYICYTDFTVDENSGLVVFQEDRFDIPGKLLRVCSYYRVAQILTLRSRLGHLTERLISVFDWKGDSTSSTRSGASCSEDAVGREEAFWYLLEKFCIVLTAESNHLSEIPRKNGSTDGSLPNTTSSIFFGSLPPP